MTTGKVAKAHKIYRTIYLILLLLSYLATMDYKINHKQNDTRGAWYINHDGKMIAEMTYDRNHDGTITIDHTETDRELEGQGIASRLMKKAVTFARENNLKIIPLCPFVEVQFERHESYRDVQAEN